MTKFSITIPAFKSRYLRKAIESVAGQTYPDWELVIVDDCSPEDIRSVVAPFLSDRRVSYYRNERNFGAENVVDNWNTCLRHATGEYIICMGDDDMLLPCCLEEYVRVMEKYPGLNVYHARTEIVDDNDRLTDLQEPRPEWESALSMLWNRWAARNKQFIGDFCFKTQYLRDAGGYFKLPLAWGSDDVTAVMAAADKGIANTQVFCFQYRKNGLTITSSADNAELKMQATMSQYGIFETFLKEQDNGQLSDTDRKYLATIATPRRDYYRKSLGRNCIDGAKGNPFAMFRYARKLSGFGFSRMLWLRWYLSSLYSLLKKKQL